MANLPLVAGAPLPKELFEIDQSRIVGLTIDPTVLMSIRRNRVGGCAAWPACLPECKPRMIGVSASCPVCHVHPEKLACPDLPHMCVPHLIPQVTSMGVGKDVGMSINYAELSKINEVGCCAWPWPPCTMPMEPCLL